MFILSFANDLVKAFVSSLVMVTLDEAVFGVGFDSISGVEFVYNERLLFTEFFCKEVGKLSLGLSLCDGFFMEFMFAKRELLGVLTLSFIGNPLSFVEFIVSAGVFCCECSFTEEYGLLTLNALSILC